MKRLSAKLTYSNVVATLALFLVLAGGTAFAASQALPKNSVGSKQIKKEAVTPPKLSKAAKATLTGATGPAGAPGPAGAKGEKGATGNANVITYNLGAHNFNTEGEFVHQIPGVTSLKEVEKGTYQVNMEISPDLDYAVPGFGSGGSTDYRVFLREESPSDISVVIEITGPTPGPGEAYTNIQLTRIEASSVVG
jgi:hypothetical protein